jgi:hypothetical protein
MKSQEQITMPVTFEQKMVAHFPDLQPRQVAEQIFNLVSGGFEGADNANLTEAEQSQIFSIITATAKELKPFFEDSRAEHSKARMEAYRKAVITIDGIIDTALSR